MSLTEKSCNKPLKHLQHERLRKEEDEEQWISGEELCTEGSSDEDTLPTEKLTSKPKSKHVSLFKSSFHKRGNTSKNTRKRPEMTEVKMNYAANVETAGDLGENLIQWRPKRGSIKLPNIEADPYTISVRTGNWKDENENLPNLTIIDVLNNISTLKERFSKEDCGSTESKNILEQITVEKHQVNTLLMEDINMMEMELNQSEEIWKNCKKDRVRYETDVCKKLTKLNICPMQLRNTRQFFKMCAFNPKKKAKVDKNKASVPALPKINRKNKTKYLKHKKILKNRKMNSTEINFTDEEKLRLADLLSDMDEKGENIAISSEDNKNKEKAHQNLFKFNNSEKSRMDSVDEKLKILQEKCENRPKENSIALKENCDWKDYLKSDRIKQIDSQLARFKSGSDATILETEKPETEIILATEKVDTEKNATDKVETENRATEKVKTEKHATEKGLTEKRATEKGLTEKRATEKGTVSETTEPTKEVKTVKEAKNSCDETKN